MTAILALPDYIEIGAEHWLRARRDKYDPIGRVLADGHYSRRTPGAPQFMPPGETLVFISRDGLSVFGWWRPDPRRFPCAMNGLDGWTCCIYRRTGGVLASTLLLDAERALINADRMGLTNGPLGPHGMLSYVDPKKVGKPGDNPGYCYKCAGWVKIGKCSKNRKPLFWKPFELAGIEACGLKSEAPKPKAPKKRARKRNVRA